MSKMQDREARTNFTQFRFKYWHFPGLCSPSHLGGMSFVTTVSMCLHTVPSLFPNQQSPNMNALVLCSPQATQQQHTHHQFFSQLSSHQTQSGNYPHFPSSPIPHSLLASSSNKPCTEFPSFILCSVPSRYISRYLLFLI